MVNIVGISFTAYMASKLKDEIKKAKNLNANVECFINQLGADFISFAVFKTHQLDSVNPDNLTATLKFEDRSKFEAFIKSREGIMEIKSNEII